MARSIGVSTCTAIIGSENKATIHNSYLILSPLHLYVGITFLQKYKNSHLTNNSKHCLRGAVFAGDVVVGLAGVHPTHVYGKRRRDVLSRISHQRIIVEPFVEAGRV